MLSTNAHTCTGCGIYSVRLVSHRGNKSFPLGKIKFPAWETKRNKYTVRPVLIMHPSLTPDRRQAFPGYGAKGGAYLEIIRQCLLIFERLALILHPRLSIEQSINQINNCQNERFITKH